MLVFSFYLVVLRENRTMRKRKKKLTEKRTRLKSQEEKKRGGEKGEEGDFMSALLSL